MTVHEVKLFDKWMNLRSAGMVKSDIFEIIDDDEAVQAEKTAEQPQIEDLPPEFFDFFMVIKTS